jgi:membrane protein insertase Oxa1/YidC/SpoIIIJ
LDPLSWESPNGLFRYITAGIPSFIIAFLVYAVIIRLWIFPPMQEQQTSAPIEAQNEKKTASAQVIDN